VTSLPPASVPLPWLPFGYPKLLFELAWCTPGVENLGFPKLEKDSMQVIVLSHCCHLLCSKHGLTSVWVSLLSGPWVDNYSSHNNMNNEEDMMKVAIVSKCFSLFPI
jgi:hypothetical protein